MRSKTAALIAAVATLPLAAGAALATTPSGLTSEPLARGAAGTFQIDDESLGFEVEAERPTDVAVVRATLAPGGYTGWHGHPGRSLVVVKSGTITMYEPRRHHGHHRGGDDRARTSRHGGGCTSRPFAAGQAFAHPKDVHNFVNHGSVPAEFYVVYFVPQGATPLLNDAGVPPGC